MNRIINDNYIERLNLLISEFEISKDLLSFMKFLIDEVQIDYNSNVNRNIKVFNLNKLQKLNELNDSESIKRLFAYLNIIIKNFNGRFLHIHINEDLTDKHIDYLISHFTWGALLSGKYDEQLLKTEIEVLNSKIIREIYLNGNGHEENRLRREKKGLRHRAKLIKQILDFNHSENNTGILLNLNTSASSCVNLSEYSEFPDALNTYVNFGNSLQSIYESNNTILQNINTIISLFPAERGQNIWYNDFISEHINAWNQLPGYNFNKVITITSGRKDSEGLLDIQKQNKFQAEEIYTIFSFEIEYMHINFYDIEDSNLISYHYYSYKVSNNDLLELNSYKIRNVLSLVFNLKIRDIILDSIFNVNGTLISVETKDNLFKHLSAQERSELKIYLSTYLDYQIKSEWYNVLCKILNSESINTIVIPSQILSHDLILSQLKKIFPGLKFVDWLNYDQNKEALILDYNHAWQNRNICTVQNIGSHAIFLKHFFENTFQWKLYREERHIFNRMNTKTRENIFGKELITQVKQKLSSLRPEVNLNEWDVFHENNHKYSLNPQEEIVISYNPTNSNRYRISVTFLLVIDKKYSIKTAKELVANPINFENKFQFSNLENIISQIDLGKLNKAIEKDKSIDLIIQPLWKKFNLDENGGRLWKQLLHRKVKDYGTKEVYSEIERISGIKQFISLNTFENAYCNPENSTIVPREKIVFKAICSYLELPLEYRAAMHRERNLIGGHSQELHSKLKDLIKVIVEYGVLDKHSDDDALIETLNNVVDKIEKNIDMDFFGFTRDSLIYACIEICFEITDKMKLKPILKIEHIKPN